MVGVSFDTGFVLLELFCSVLGGSQLRDHILDVT